MKKNIGKIILVLFGAALAALAAALFFVYVLGMPVVKRL